MLNTFDDLLKAETPLNDVEIIITSLQTDSVKRDVSISINLAKTQDYLWSLKIA